MKFWLDVESFRSSASLVITSTYVPPQVSRYHSFLMMGPDVTCHHRERLDRVTETPGQEEDYSEADSACPPEPSLLGPATLPESSASTESFDSGLDSRSESTLELPCSPSPCSSPPEAGESGESPPARGRAEHLLQTRAEDAVRLLTIPR